MNKSDLVLLRSYQPLTDEGFIFSSWLRALRDNNEYFKMIEPDMYYQNYHRFVEMILGLPDTKVTIACMKDDPSIILGYSVFSDRAVHWVYVKEIWRRIGISTLLIPKDFTHYTHITERGKKILDQKYPHTKFNPFLI